jgi:hypothetical protein
MTWGGDGHVLYTCSGDVRSFEADVVAYDGAMFKAIIS